MGIFMGYVSLLEGNTLDGRNHAPVHVVDIQDFMGFYTSQVVQDLFHQQYLINHDQIYLFFGGATRV